MYKLCHFEKVIRYCLYADCFGTDTETRTFAGIDCLFGAQYTVNQRKQKAKTLKCKRLLRLKIYEVKIKIKHFSYENICLFLFLHFIYLIRWIRKDKRKMVSYIIGI